MSPLFVLLADATLKATAVLVAAILAMLVLRRAAAATRHLVWTLALAGLLVIPTLALLPGWQMPIASPWHAAPTDANPAIVAAPARAFAARSLPKPMALQVSQPAGPLPAAPLDDAAREAVSAPAPPASSAVPVSAAWTLPELAWRLTAFWLMGVAVFGLWIALAAWQLRRLAHSCHWINTGPLHDLTMAIAAQLGIRRKPRLLQSANRLIPATWGLFRPAVLLPVEAASWTTARQRMILLHELGHVARWDCATNLLGQLARCVFWFHPLTWWAIMKQRQEQEIACDDLVVQSGAAADEYAEHLLAVTAQLPEGYLQSALALGMARASRLRGRLTALLDDTRRRTLSRGVCAALCLLALGFVVSAASARWTLPPPAVQAPVILIDDDPQAPMTPDALKKLEEIRKKLRENYVGPLDDKQLTEAAIKGLLQGLKDPYTDYLPAEELSMFESQLKGAFFGIGIQLKMIQDRLTVLTPIDNSPALKAGLRPGDTIEAIDGQSTRGIDLQKAVKQILGANGTEVKLKIVRDDGVVTEVAVTRGPIRVATVQGFQRTAKGAWAHLLDGDHKIGYLRITQFNTSTAEETRAAIQNLQKDGLKGLILDLRSCPGGMLDQALAVCKLFIADGKLLTIKGTGGKNPTEFDADGTALGDFPLLVLVNEQTASAGEIVAGVLLDRKRAVVLGTRTFGKGSVQSIVKLDEGGALKVTTAYYYLPSGRTLHKKPSEKTWGVDPSEGFYLALTKAQHETLLKNQMDRGSLGHAPGEGPKAAERITPRVLDEQFHDPQLGAAQRTMVARLTGGEFIKVGQAKAPSPDELLHMEELQRRREALLQDLQKLEKDIDAARLAGGSKK